MKRRAGCLTTGHMAARSSRGDNVVGNEAHVAAWSTVSARVAPGSVRSVVSNTHHWQNAQEYGRQTDSIAAAFFQDAQLEQHPATNHVRLEKASASSASRRHAASPEAHEHRSYHHDQRGVAAVEHSPGAQSFNFNTYCTQSTGALCAIQCARASHEHVSSLEMTQMHLHLTQIKALAASRSELIENLMRKIATMRVQNSEELAVVHMHHSPSSSAHSRVLPCPAIVEVLTGNNSERAPPSAESICSSPGELVLFLPKSTVRNEGSASVSDVTSVHSLITGADKQSASFLILESRTAAGDIARELGVLRCVLERGIHPGAHECLWKPIQSILAETFRVPLPGVTSPFTPVLNCANAQPASLPLDHESRVVSSLVVAVGCMVQELERVNFGEAQHTCAASRVFKRVWRLLHSFLKGNAVRPASKKIIITSRTIAGDLARELGVLRSALGSGVPLATHQRL